MVLKFIALTLQFGGNDELPYITHKHTLCTKYLQLKSKTLKLIAQNIG